jgi:hypothetical protein
MKPKMAHQPKSKKLTCKQQNARIQVQNTKKNESTQDLQKENYENT